MSPAAFALLVLGLVVAACVLAVAAIALILLT